MTDRTTTFGLWVRRRRRMLDLTQAELAVRAGCVLTTIKKIETGTRVPSHRLALLLADALSLSDAERAWFLQQLRAPSAEAPAVQQVPPAPPAAPPEETRVSATLPLPPGPLIGRSRDIVALRALLTMPTSRLVTLTGPGGIGKTRLALLLAAELGDMFVDGVFFVDLAPLNDPALLPLTLTRSLGLQPGTDPLATLLRAIEMQHMLLVFDNFEQILAAAPVVGELLAAAPRLTVLATSRAPLRLAAEHVYDVPPLELPPLDNPHALDTYAAVQLFVRRAQAVQHAFVLTPEYGSAVAEICRRLDGLPLAIEMAAAWVGVLPPLALLRRLDQRLALLTHGHRDLPARQQTLQATLDWSFRLLSAPERRLFARLGVFVGGVTLEGVEQVCWANERSDPFSMLHTLVEHSFLRQQPNHDGEPHFMMLETIREYALTQLAAEGDEAELRSRHAHYYLALAETAVPQLRGPAQRHWLDLLEGEHDNLRAACAWLIEAQRPLEALRLVGALSWFWDRRGYLHEGRALIQHALHAAEAASTSDTALQQARGWAHVGAATLAFDQGDWAASAASADTAIDHFRPLEEHRGLSLALLRVAFERAMTDPMEAHNLLVEAGVQAAATNDLWFVGLAHFVTAQAALFGTNDPASARAQMEAALPALRMSGDPYLIAHGLATTGSINLAEGNFDSARGALEEGTAIARTLSDTRSVALLAATTADVARCQAEYERAAELYSESLALYHKLGNHAEIPAILHNQGYVALGQGDAAAAQELFRESLRRHQARANLAGIAEGLAGLAAVAVAAGTPMRAARLFGAAEAVRAQHGGPMWPAERFEVERQQAAALRHLPEPLFAQQRHAGAALSLEQAIAEALMPSAESPLAATPRAPGGLTPREYEVASLVAQGHTNKVIAAALVISERTAEHHVANILAKLDFSSRAQVAAWVVATNHTPNHT